MVTDRLIAVAGNLRVKQLAASHVIEAAEMITGSGWEPSTVHVRLAILRNVLLWVWSNFGAPKLDEIVPRTAALHPRNVVARRDEIDAILRLCDKPMRLYVLLCSDLAIRSGTAMKIAPQMYDPHTHTLRFQSKKNSLVVLPVTAAIEELFNQCRLDTDEPFITQLCQDYRKKHKRNRVMDSSTFRKRFQSLRRQAGVKRRFTPHDMRRRSAVELYKYTHDVRKVQRLLGHSSLGSTIWYLDNEIEPLDAQMLETIKRPFLVRKPELEEKAS